MRGIITILARAGSKGLPNKHILPFNGKPLVEWTIEHAVRIADKEHGAYSLGQIPVVVSSDSYKVLGLAEKHGAIAFQRSKELAQDDIGKVDAVREVLIEYGSENFDLVIDLDASNPCRLLEDIEKSFQIFKKKRPQTLFSVTKAKKNPYFNQVFNIGGEYRIVMDEYEDALRDEGLLWGPNERILRRQDAEDVFDINSNIYIYDSEWLSNPENKFVVTDNSEIYTMPDWTYCDIDTWIDFEVAEFLHRKYMLDYHRDDCEVNGRS